MKSVNKIIKKLTGSLGSSEKILNELLNGPYIYGVIVLIIGMYGPRLSPRLPRPVRDLFNNAYFRFAVLTMVIYLSNRNLYLALTVSIAFVLVLNLTNSLEVEEHFVKKYAENFSEYGTVLVERFEDDDEKKEGGDKKDYVPEPVKKEVVPKQKQVDTADDFGNASYRQGYTDGQEAQCPIDNTGGLAYSEVTDLD